MRIGLMPGATRDTVELKALVNQVIRAEADGFDNAWLPQISTFGYDALTVASLAAKIRGGMWEPESDQPSRV